MTEPHSPFCLRILLTFFCLALMTSCGGGEAGKPTGDERLATLQLDATFPEGFGYLSGIRLLSDGRILAADPNSQVLLRLDLDAGTADTLGGHGKGPQEYEGPDQVFPLPGDSTLLVDLGNGRLTVVGPEGTFVDWTPMSNRNELAPGGIRTVRPQFVDMAGNIYVTAPYWLEGPPDSTAIHRVDRASGVETSVAWEWHPERVRRPRGAKRPMLVLSDDWAVGADGRVAVVRSNGYSVDWYLPDGRVTQGAPYDVETFPVGPAEMEAQVERFAADATYTFAMVGEGGIQSQQTSRGLPPGTTQEVDDFEWPEMLPVFWQGRTLVSPWGEAWVQRHMPAGGPGRIEVFDKQGIRLGYVELSPGSKVLGFGAGADAESIAYVAREDNMGLIWLERRLIVWMEDRR